MRTILLCENGGKTLQIRDDDGTVIIELRGDGAQTMIPSTHTDGANLVFRSVNTDFADFDYNQLVSLINKVALSTLIARHWKVGIDISYHFLSAVFYSQ